MTLKRYYLDCGRTNPELDLTALHTAVHALYTHWVRGNAHRRDFVCATVHAADCIFIDYLLSGTPCLKNAPAVPAAPTLAVPREVPSAPAERFYDEFNEINPSIDCNQHIPVLGSHFVQWVAAENAPRDFTQAVRDVSAAVVYHHELCESLGGLGGGKSAEQFLSTPYMAGTPG